MLSVILIWSYIGITSYLIGFGVIKGIFDRNNNIKFSRDSYLMAGLAVLTVYSQFFSIFYKVGLAANILLLIFCTGISIIMKKQLRAAWDSDKKSLSLKKIIIGIIIIIIFAYGSSTGIIHYDTGLYHAQSIRWIEEFGLIKGLGNLHCRLAYNSAAFSLSALYSMAFWGGQSFHCIVGFMALLLFGVCIKGIALRDGKDVCLSDFAKVAAVYYLLNIYDEMVSPASDYFVILMIFYLVIKWLMLLERKEESYLPYALLCLLGVCIMTVKLSAALILLLTIKPACMMIRKKQKKEIACFMGCGALTVLPYLIRNVLISGWLIYPYTKLDLFHVDWKIPEGMAEYDYREIQMWGRGLKDVTLYELPIWEWLPGWFASQGMVDKLFITASVGAVVILCIATIVKLIQGIVVRGRTSYQEESAKDSIKCEPVILPEMTDWLLAAGTLCLSFLFWLTSAPLIRYGCVYVYLTPCITYGYLYLKWKRKKWRNVIFTTMVCLLASYKAVAFGKEVVTSFQTEHLIIQKDYENFDTISYTLQGYTFYYPQEGDRTGYHDFPSSPARAEIELRGNTMREGIRAKEKEGK